MNKKNSFVKKLLLTLFFSFVFLYLFFGIFIKEIKAEDPIITLSEEWCGHFCEEPYSGGICAYCIFEQVEGEGGCTWDWGYRWAIGRSCYMIMTTGYCGPYYVYAIHIPLKLANKNCNVRQGGIYGYGCTPPCISLVEDNVCFSPSAYPDPDYYFIGYRYPSPTLEELGFPTEPIISTKTTPCFRFEIPPCEYMFE